MWWLRLAVVLTVLSGAVALQTGRALSLSVTTSAVALPSVTLDGTTQVVSGSGAPWRVDATSEAGGWNLTVASTDFTAASRTIAVSNFSVRLLNTDIALVSGDPAGPTSQQETFAALSGTPLRIASAAVGDGDGVYDLTPGFQLTVPAETYAGSYSATLTVDVTVSP